ncbi:hypothetical protein CK203_044773 [Vitis vinifera]|uniref:Uncharacterized protein n=1 Tax=Vitis vinifera TaxID=29760 RepID=A0A438H6X3_VITVI|nr:hypothetical protein CK203_044773 [Vitis vinifera]
MGGRSPILVGLVLVMVLGCAIYFRLWTIDYTISSDETEILRRQFDLANREAMDESAEWRLKYDEEVERATKCLNELIKINAQRSGESAAMILRVLNSHRHNMTWICSIDGFANIREVSGTGVVGNYSVVFGTPMQVKESSEKKVEDAASTNQKLAMLQKENMALLERVESLKQELEAEKLKCSLQ